MEELKMAAKKENVFLDTEHEGALKEIIKLKSLSELKTISKILRFIIMDYHKLITSGYNPDVKLKQVAKQIAAIENLLYIQIAHTPLLDDVKNYVRSDQTNLKYVVDKHVEDVLNGKYKKIKSKVQNVSSVADMSLEKHYDSNLLSHLKQEKENEDFITQLESLKTEDDLTDKSFEHFEHFDK